MSKQKKRKQKIRRKLKYFSIFDDQELAKNIFDPNLPTDYNDLNNYCPSYPTLSKYDLPEFSPGTDPINSIFYLNNKDFLKAHSIVHLNRFQINIFPFTSNQYIHSKIKTSIRTKFILQFTRKIPAGKNKEIQIASKIWIEYSKQVDYGESSRHINRHETEGDLVSYARRYDFNIYEDLLDKKIWFRWNGFYLEFKISLINLKNNKLIREKIIPRQKYQDDSFEYLNNIYNYGFPACLGKHFLAYQNPEGITLLDRNNFSNTWIYKDVHKSSYKKIFYLNKKGNFLSFSDNPLQFNILKLKSDGTLKIRSILSGEDVYNYAVTVDPTGRYLFFVNNYPKLKVFDLQKEKTILELPLNRKIIDLAYDHINQILLILDKSNYISTISLNLSQFN
ncbi:MAG: hypothetical protein PF689_01955 [Deltaproteobacteria bacterium]|jgi:hypothetical protein|nr:hypothetical protein [Deltaproteobacteria bacterium]